MQEWHDPPVEPPALCPDPELESTEVQEFDPDAADRPLRRTATYASTTSRLSIGGVQRHVRASVQFLMDSVRQDLQARQEGNAQSTLWEGVNALKKSKTRGDVASQKTKRSMNIFARCTKALEMVTGVVICINAIFIGYDADYAARWGQPDNLYEGPIQFIIAENLFAIYFTFELFMRFLGFKHKLRCLCDGWFIFDSMLVTMMILETYFFPFLLSSGNSTSKLSILRLLRLLRVSRIMRIIRMFPDFMLIIKAMAAAFRATSWAAVLLLLELYVFSILFCSIYHQGRRTDEEVADTVEGAFGSTGKSMFTLFFLGTLRDNVTAPANLIRGDSRSYMLALFIISILINSFMIINMLTGICVQVVANLSISEKRIRVHGLIKMDLLQVCEDIADENDPFGMTRDDLLDIYDNEEIAGNLINLGIRIHHIPVLADILFGDEEECPDDMLVQPVEIVKKFMQYNAEKAGIKSGQFMDAQKMISNKRFALRKRLTKCERLLKAMDTKRFQFAEGSESSFTSSRTKDWRKDQSGDLTGTPCDDGCFTPPHSARKRITIEMVAKLNALDTSLLVEEVRRRLGCECLGDTGVPAEWLDAETHEMLATVEVSDPNEVVTQ